MFCKYCGATIDNDTVYCPSCGEKQTSTNNDTYHRPAPVRETPPVRDDKYYENNQNRPPLSVNFFDSIKNYYINYATFNGRTVRSEFLWSFLYTMLAIIVIRFVLKDYPIINTIWTIVHIIPDISIRVRRLHDIGKSGWNYLLNLIPIVGPIILMVYLLKGSSYSDNIWGLTPYNVSSGYDDTKTWRCEKCGCRTPNSSLTCKNCGTIKPSPKSSPYTPPKAEQSTKCVCGERVYGKVCPVCGREVKQSESNSNVTARRSIYCDNCQRMISSYPCPHCGKSESNNE